MYNKFKKLWPKQGLAIRVFRLLILNLYARKVSMHKLLLFMADILEVHTDGMQANSIQTYFALRHHKCKQKPNRKIFWDNFQFLYQTSLKLPKYSKPEWYYQLKNYQSDWSSYRYIAIIIVPFCWIWIQYFSLKGKTPTAIFWRFQVNIICGFWLCDAISN